MTAPKACPLDELRVEATIENVRRILADIGGGLFVTVFYGVLDPSSGQLTYSASECRAENLQKNVSNSPFPVCIIK